MYREKLSPMPRSRVIFASVAIQTLARGTVILARQLLLDMAAAAQIVELLFNQMGNLRVGVVAVKAHAGTGVVHKVVMALDTILCDMVGVGKINR